MNKFLGTVLITNEITEPKSKKCIACNKDIILGSGENTTHSFIAGNGKHLTYFFRTHKKCWENLSSKEQKIYNDSLVDNL